MAQSSNPGGSPQAVASPDRTTSTESSPRLRFAHFVLDERSGELWCDDPSDRQGQGDAGAAGERPVTGPAKGPVKGSVKRLAPQPARLLAHLIRRSPQVVSRGEIKELLWPDVEVEFEQSLHTCVRQIRAALGDSAAEPEFIETIPRRGYRLRGAAGDVAPVAELVPPVRRSSRLLAAAAGVVVVLLLAVLGWRYAANAREPVMRIGIMPFEPADEASPLAVQNGLAEEILGSLMACCGERYEIVGPTTTERYDRPPRIEALIEDLDLDYLINGRELRKEQGPLLLIEIIRAHDGAHVWVADYDRLPAGGAAAAVVRELRQRLDEAPR